MAGDLLVVSLPTSLYAAHVWRSERKCDNVTMGGKYSMAQMAYSNGGAGLHTRDVASKRRRGM
jgi:hypothetical protein